MPRQVFTAGEILTAANMNDLSDQSVMVFDDSAARGSAIPTPSEGMVTYLSDVNQVQAYTGSAFTPVSGLVAVKSALKSDTQTFTSLAGGADAAITGLSITHELADSSNKLIISAFIGLLSAADNFAQAGIALHDGTNLIGIGDSAGSRARFTAGAMPTATGAEYIGISPSVTFVHSPGAGSKTYTVRVVNYGSAQNVFVNRTDSDGDSSNRQRTISSLVIQEVAV
jgi:hypothetical protein